MANKKKEKRPPIVSKTLFYMLKVISKKAKGLYALYFLKFLGRALGEVQVLLLPKLLIDELELVINGADKASHVKPVIIYVALTLAALFLSRFLENICDSHKNVYSNITDLYFQEKLAEKSMEMDFQYTETPDVLDKQEKAKTGISWYSGGAVSIIDCFFQTLYSIALMITSVVIIAIYCPLLLPIQIIGMGLITYFNYRNQLIQLRDFAKLAKHNRVFGYVYFTLTDYRYGKDIRLYNGKDMMARQADYWAQSQVDIWEKQAGERVKNDYCGDIANAVRDGISYFYMGYRALKKIISLGEFTMCVASASRLYNSLLGIAMGIRQINEKCNYAYHYVEFMEFPGSFSTGERKIEDKPHVIEFKDVSFKYPRTDNYVLEHVNIKIDSNEHLSIVGLNGAGKTTFIKLLCRLYDVTEGEILIDGVNIKEYSDEEYKKFFAVVFQDFKLFAFSLRDNIALGDISSEPKQEKIEEALKLSGLYDDAVKLDNGLDTMLYKSFDEKGTELSGGQQQKTAISRALYRNAPIIILDEPTAALDPMAEYEIYSKFDTLVGNKSAIYISHRLSSCKFCDKIAVFADKTIKEYGTHNDLVNIEGGIYAEMFKTQAQYYVDSAKAAM